MNKPTIVKMSVIYNQKNEVPSVFGLGSDSKVYRWRLNEYEVINSSMFNGYRRDRKGNRIVTVPAHWELYE